MADVTSGSGTRRQRVVRTLSEKLLRRPSYRVLREVEWFVLGQLGCLTVDRQPASHAVSEASSDMELFRGDAHKTEQPKSGRGRGRGGLHFSVEISPDGDVVACGVPQPVMLEQLQPQRAAPSKSRLGNLCHPPKSTQLRVRRVDEAVVAHSSAPYVFPIRSSLLLSRTQSVRQVACGVSHCIALSKLECGGLQLYAWGIGYYGQLGLGDGTAVSTTMVPITASTELLGTLCANANRAHAVRLRCGPLTSCLTITDTVSSSVWLWGLIPTSGDQFACQTVPSDAYIASCAFRIKDVNVGLAHLVLLSESGVAFTWGQNSSGQLGVGLQHKLAQGVLNDSPVQVDLPDPSVRIVSISSGYEHTLAATSDGARIYAWGSNRLGACGAATKFFEYAHPVVVSDVAHHNERVLSVSCKAHTSVAVVASVDDQSVRVISWGVGSTHTALLRPTEALISMVVDDSWFDVSAGYGEINYLCDSEDAISTDRKPDVDETTIVRCTPAPASPALMVTVMAMGIIASRDLSTAPRLRDLRWSRPSQHRVRVFASDTIVLLVKCLCLDVSLTMRASRLDLVEPEEDPWNPIVSTDYLAVQDLSLHVVVVRAERVGSFDIQAFATGRDDNNDLKGIILVSVDCCEHPLNRRNILYEQRDFIRQCFTKAMGECTTLAGGTYPDKGLFTCFIRHITQNSILFRAIAHSHLAAPSENRHGLSTDWDLDRCALEKATTLAWFVHTPISLPSSFAPWAEPLGLIDTDDGHDEQGLTPRLDYEFEGIHLRELLGSRKIDGQDDHDCDGSELLYFAVCNIPVQHILANVAENIDGVIQSTARCDQWERSPVSLAAPLSVCVPQTASDFLVQDSHARHEITKPQHFHANLTHPIDIRLWKDQRGDAFYSSIRSSVSVPEIYEPNKYDMAERRTNIRRLQRAIHQFLWTTMGSQQIGTRTLYSQLGAVNDSTLLQNRLRNMGFGNEQARRETWYSVFRVLLHFVDDWEKEGRCISLHALRVFLVDPHHDDFWRLYLSCWRDSLTKSCQSSAIGDILADAFPTSDQKWISWEAFADGLQHLHRRLQWELDDQTTCRLMYRFDSKGNGQIALHDFIRSLVRAAATRNPDPVKTSDEDSSCLGRTRLQRPQVDDFTTPTAVRNLYQTRSLSLVDPESISKLEETDHRTLQLLRMGNSRLAKIRNLPVSRILR